MVVLQEKSHLITFSSTVHSQWKLRKTEKEEHEKKRRKSKRYLRLDVHSQNNPKNITSFCAMQAWKGSGNIKTLLQLLKKNINLAHYSTNK